MAQGGERGRAGGKRNRKTVAGNRDHHASGAPVTKTDVTEWPLSGNNAVTPRVDPARVDPARADMIRANAMSLGSLNTDHDGRITGWWTLVLIAFGLSLLTIAFTVFAPD
jgi:hypothetical protein